MGDKSLYALTENDQPVYLFKENKSLYICPVCLQKAIYRDEQYSDFLLSRSIRVKFTDDHYPPKSVIGKGKMLVCEDCNSGLGAEIDYAASEYLGARLVLYGNKEAKIPVKITVPGLPGYSKAYMTWTEGGGDFQIKHTAEKRLFSYLQQRPLIEGDQIHIKGSFASPQLFYRSMLKAALLKCFETWGYDFGLSETAYRLRQVIVGKMEHPASHCLGVFFQRPDKMHKEGLFKTNLLDGKPYYICYFLIGVYNQMQTVFVVIPEEGKISWQRMSCLPNLPNGTSIETEEFEVPEFIKLRVYYGYTGRDSLSFVQNLASSVKE